MSPQFRDWRVVLNEAIKPNLMLSSSLTKEWSSWGSGENCHSGKVAPQPTTVSYIGDDVLPTLHLRITLPI